MSEPLKVAEEILGKIKELESYKTRIGVLSRSKVQAEADYELALAKTIVALKNGKEFKLGNEPIINPPTTIVEKIARGLCYKEKIAADTNSELLKVNDKKVEIIKAQLNGYQSINKHLGEI